MPSGIKADNTWHGQPLAMKLWRGEESPLLGDKLTLTEVPSATLAGERGD